MKKTLSLILAVMMLLGAFSITAFATTDNTTDITLTVAKPLTYDMVIPEDVTNLNAAGVYEVGQAKVANVKNATDKTVISYTAETTAFKCEGKTDIPASYYTDEAGQNDFPTTAVEVYKSKADAASIPTMYVGISETDWNAAENGTYTATVTFNFTAKEVVTLADILPEDFPIGEDTDEPVHFWPNENRSKAFIFDNYLCVREPDDGTTYMIGLSDAVTEQDGKYVWTDPDDGQIFVFNMNGDKFVSIIVSNNENSKFNGTYQPD